MEINVKHATLEQVRAGRDGRRVLIEDDVLDAVKRLQELDPALKVFWNEFGNYFVIVEMLADGSESLVTTTQDLHAQLVEYVAKLSKTSMKEELDRVDREADRAKEHRFEEKVGEIGERMAHTIREKHFEYKGKAFVPKDIPS